MSNATKKKFFRLVYIVVFTIYLAFLTYFLFFSDVFGRTVAYDTYRYNLKPFAEITRYFTKVRDKNYLTFFINIAGNVILFVPFGFLFPFISEKNSFKRGRTFMATLLVSVLFCLLIEGIQLVTKVGVFDVDDIMMNTLGSMLGYIIYRAARRKNKETDKKTGVRHTVQEKAVRYHMEEKTADNRRSVKIG